ncbi:MAG: hypothetical protein V1873_06650 [Verrucomicrobiota bacterium]
MLRWSESETQVNALLIQPPDPPQAVAPFEPPPGDSQLLAPAWELLCLRSYLYERTRHLCSVVDCRFHADLEKELTEAVEGVPDLGVAAVNASTIGLGQAAAVIEIMKRRFPDVKVAVFGQHPSQFPEHAAAMPWVDFALAGDPEPILRNLLDYQDVEQRLRRVPGLVMAGHEAGEAYWLPDLRGLALPDWQGVFWGAYRVGLKADVCRAQARLSRGHPRSPADRASGGLYEPLRLWPMERLAAALQKAPAQGVTEVLLVDPPGVWTPQRLNEWCRTLDYLQNIQPWGLQLLPTLLNQDTMEYLRTSLCCRVEFVFPSCDPAVLKRYGCIVAPHDLGVTMGRLEELGLRVHSRFWIGGPEEGEGEDRRVAQTIRSLGFRSFSLHAFPCLPDTHLYEKYADLAPKLEDWIAWARSPWTERQPVAVWGGEGAAEDIDIDFDLILTAVRRHPRNLLKRMLEGLFAKNWISVIESKALGLIPKPAPPGGRDTRSG